MAVTINYEQIRITELDSYLFGQGTHYEIYNKMEMCIRDRINPC